MILSPETGFFLKSTAWKKCKMKDSVKWKRIIYRTAGVAVACILVLAVIRQTDFSSLLDQMKQAGWFFPAVIGVTFCSQFIAVYAWFRSFLKILPAKNLFHLFCIRLVGESLAQINPTNVIAGETLKGYLLKNKIGVSYMEGGASLLLSRIMIVLGSLSLLVFGIAVMFQNLDFGNLQAVSIGISLVIIVLILCFIRALSSGRGFLGWLAKIFRKCSGRLQFLAKAGDSLADVDRSLVEFYNSRKKDFYLVFMLSVLHRIVGSMEYYVIFFALGIDVTVLSCILFDLSSMLFRTAGFFIPGQLGLEEFGNKFMFDLVNIPGEGTWITVSLIRRARQIFWILAGFVIYLILSGGIKKEVPETEI